MSFRFKRVLLIILDSLGVGELPDASNYGDSGSATFQHIAEMVNGIHLPNLQQMGMGNIVEIKGLPKADKPAAYFGKMLEQSTGKDTTTGHWEMMGIKLRDPFPTYPEGFPSEIIEPFEKKIGKSIIGNYPASGTDIIYKLGRDHLKTGFPIIYTSADSVFQIAAHKSIYPLKKLYEMCQTARNLLIPPHEVCRVIARPFEGEPGKFIRTEDRRDFSLPPPKETYLDKLKNTGFQVIGIGKIDDIFTGSGLTESRHAKGNSACMREIFELLDNKKEGLIFVNLIDFDMLYGHRNDPQGYASALEQLDNQLSDLRKKMEADDLLIISADHGNDPTFPGTDHNREYAPLIVFNPKFHNCGSLGVRSSFADIGATIADNFGLFCRENGRESQTQSGLIGTSFLNNLS